MTSALDRVRAARKLADDFVSQASQYSPAVGDLEALAWHLAQAEAELLRQKKTGGRTAAVLAQAPDPIDPGLTPGTGSPRPDVAALIAVLRCEADDSTGALLPYQVALFDRAADALEAIAGKAGARWDASVIAAKMVERAPAFTQEEELICRNLASHLEREAFETLPARMRTIADKIASRLK